MSIDIASRGTSLHVTDSIEQRQCVLRTPTPATVEAVDGETFYFPVDAAASLDVGSVTLGNYVPTFVRDGAGDVVAEIDRFDECALDSGAYLVELEQPVKLYLQVRGSLKIETTGMMTTIKTDGDLRVGARSRHNHPAGTITTTGEPKELMQVVSALSSSLKTTSPERSYPTLRGHPPEIELGDELDIPDGMEAPDAGVHIEVPARREFIYPVASLAFYLGAAVVPGHTPCIVGENGYTYRLDGPGSFEQRVEETLKQLLLFDCVARNEGFYELNLEEREQVDEQVDLDWGALYDRSLTEQLRAYLSISYEHIADFVPEWKTAGYIAPTPENAELLPFLVDDLATIRMPAGETISASEAQSSAMFDFARDDGSKSPGASPDGDNAAKPTRSTSTERGTTIEEPMTTLIEPESTEAFGTIWADEGMPVGATKASIDGYRNGLDHKPSEEIGVTVVVNDEKMADEGAAAEDIYGDDSEFPFDLRVYQNLTTDRLKAVLETEREFLHYIGHIEADGFECTDGRLDVRDMEFVGIDAFFLNGCASYDQGMALLERGAVGGVVTVTEIINSGATRVGEAMVKLINHGFPLRAALSVASKQSFVGGQYSVVGDGDVDVAQRRDLGAPITTVTPTEDGFSVSIRVHPTNDLTVGSYSRSIFEETAQYSLTPGDLDSTEYTDGDQLLEALHSGGGLVEYQGKIQWPDDLEL